MLYTIWLDVTIQSTCCIVLIVVDTGIIVVLGRHSSAFIEVVVPFLTMAVDDAGKLRFRVIVIVCHSAKRVNHLRELVERSVSKMLAIAKRVCRFGKVAFNIVLKVGVSAIFILNSTRLLAVIFVNPLSHLLIISNTLYQAPQLIVEQVHTVTDRRLNPS